MVKLSYMYTKENAMISPVSFCSSYKVAMYDMYKNGTSKTDQAKEFEGYLSFLTDVPEISSKKVCTIYEMKVSDDDDKILEAYCKQKGIRLVKQ